MGLLISTGILFITGVIWWIVTGRWSDPSGGAIITTVISGAILIIECLTIALAQSGFKKNIMDYHAL